MYLPRLFLVISAGFSLASAKHYWCIMAQDGSRMIQQPYCCEGFQNAQHNDLTKIGLGCKQQTGEAVERCPNGFTPKCCYDGGVGPLCTAEAIVRDD
ncbi:hypothetical protein ETB97_012268 [Aspergillus alliaceus]|uniref:Uncharacterized protein n=1 Tax=Petromyces alliaceus TaxID=209559 RepID=A0A5N6GCZ5_PETAA|nr:uncharacterized protein BDW43DRAFT_306235 [Aspergillus alliaceus]KAB8238373.1 hypothetical protein BDW43DRAFT_306235 [Aspergillus alliaceus]KAE8392353.1 hypothetical protein BDV23DRAFT_181754 [Aspergillus alliaceus]KAF5861945.1 hypothetical protein ETB97_012268 [Aspergillus burnettii]